MKASGEKSIINCNDNTVITKLEIGREMEAIGCDIFEVLF
jgi:hypothetical protein